MCTALQFLTKHHDAFLLVVRPNLSSVLKFFNLDGFCLKVECHKRIFYFIIYPALFKFFVNYIILSQHRTAVDTEEIYDYLEYVEKPMDFDQMLTKLDNGEYHCAQDFLDDIDLVADNAVKYNSDLNYETNKVLCHRAKSLQDFAYALIKADMDTDFEDNCKVCTV